MISFVMRGKIVRLSVTCKVNRAVTENLQDFIFRLPNLESNQRNPTYIQYIHWKAWKMSQQHSKFRHGKFTRKILKSFEKCWLKKNFFEKKLLLFFLETCPLKDVTLHFHKDRFRNHGQNSVAWIVYLAAASNHRSCISNQSLHIPSEHVVGRDPVTDFVSSIQKIPNDMFPQGLLPPHNIKYLFTG